MKMKLTLNKKIVGTVAAGLFVMSVMGVGAGLGIGTVNAHDPVEEHEHPHVEPAPITMPIADSAVMEERMAQMFHDAGFDAPSVTCDTFSGSYTASADGMLAAQSATRVLGHPWDETMEDSAAHISVGAGADAVVCAGAAVRSSISGTGFSSN